MRKNRRTDEKLSLRLGTLVPTQGFTQSLTRSLTSGVTSTSGFAPLSLNPVFWFDMDSSMLAAGDVAAEEADLVATLENKVSGGPNATQTTASEQARAHVPLGDGHLYLSGVSGNYASVPDADNLDGFDDFAMEFVGASEDWHDGLALTLIGKWRSGHSSYIVRLQANGTIFILYSSSTTDYTAYSNASHNLVDGSKGGIRVVRSGSSLLFYENLYQGSGWQQIGTTVSGNAATLANRGHQVEIGSYNYGISYPFNGPVFSTKIWNSSSPDTASPVLDIDFSTAAHKASSFTCASGQTVTINTSGNDPATIVRKSFMRMDLVDDEYEFTTDAAVNGTIVVATLEGTYSANISLSASTQYDLQARGVAASANYGFLKNVIGYLITPTQLSDAEITNIEAYFVDKGAAARSAFGSVTNFNATWNGCPSLTSFPEINTSSGTNFTNAWRSCSSLTSFPLIDTSSGTEFAATWNSCTSLTSFPEINTSSGTNFSEAWRNCSSLTSFPAINTSSGTNFFYAWFNCNSLTSFPLINTSSGTNFASAWRSCSSLTSFPLINTSSGTSFDRTWRDCSSLTSFPLIDTSSGTNFGYAWRNCSSLTSFPAINTSSATNFGEAWYNCSSLTSFPAINTSSGTNFFRTWQHCTSLTSFPAIDTSSAEDLRQAWYGCNSLTSFPANFFDSWSPAALTNGALNFTWSGCTSLTAQSVENILTSIDTSGIYGTTTGLSGGTQLADNTIDIDYDGTTLSSATTTAIANLKTKDWAISINSVIQ